jgi:hypothetical protein
LASYQRAIHISPNQAPAWQVSKNADFFWLYKLADYINQFIKGLAQLYEKGNNQSDLASAYYELTKIFKACVFILRFLKFIKFINPLIKKLL